MVMWQVIVNDVVVCEFNKFHLANAVARELGGTLAQQRV